MKSLVVDALGAGAGFCSMASFAPQVAKIWREKDAAAVSMKMYVVTVAGFILWTAYGAAIARWPLVVANAVCLALSATVLVLKWRFDAASASRPRPPPDRPRP
ncbi:MAG: SemiSWEET family sugar transporter [Caulobacteraceae bacterium]